MICQVLYTCNEHNILQEKLARSPDKDLLSNLLSFCPDETCILVEETDKKN